MELRLLSCQEFEFENGERSSDIKDAWLEGVDTSDIEYYAALLHSGLAVFAVGQGGDGNDALVAYVVFKKGV